VTTLGTSEDEQRIDSLEGEYYKTFMLHYNFPPFSVGRRNPSRTRQKRNRAWRPGRTGIETDAADEAGISLYDPPVSDILESNGSSSMATVCGGTLALMDAGVPIKPR